MEISLRSRYSLTELAALMGLDDSKKDSLRRTLRRAGVTLHGSQGARSKAFIYLSDLREKMPLAWESILDLQAITRE